MGEELPQLRQGDADGFQRALAAAGADRDREAGRIDAGAVHGFGDRGGGVAVERQGAGAERQAGGALGERRQRLQSAAAGRADGGVVVAPQGRVAELLAGGTELGGEAGVEAGADCEAAARELREPRGQLRAGHQSRLSRTATHSMCGVCGNMSTGRARSSS